MADIFGVKLTGDSAVLLYRTLSLHRVERIDRRSHIVSDWALGALFGHGAAKIALS